MEAGDGLVLTMHLRFDSTTTVLTFGQGVELRLERSRGMTFLENDNVRVGDDLGVLGWGQQRSGLNQGNAGSEEEGGALHFFSFLETRVQGRRGVVWSGEKSEIWMWDEEKKKKTVLVDLFYTRFLFSI